MRKFYSACDLLIVLAISTVLVLFANNVSATESLISLRKPVVLSTAEQLFIRSLPPLKVVTHEQAPPMSLYNRSNGQYEGISSDVFHFIAQQIGLQYQFVSDGHVSHSKNMQQFELGHVDVLIPISISPERSAIGLFTDPHYESFYSAIARKDDRLRVMTTKQLGQYRIGTVDKAAVNPFLQSIIPEVDLHKHLEGSIYEALRRDKVDIILLNKGVFAQDRIRLELFDLEDIYTLYDFPRSYSFLFKATTDNQKLVGIFNRYLAAIDNNASIRAYEDGEYRLIEKYIKKQSEQQLLWIVIAVVSLLLFLVIKASRNRKQILGKLAASHSTVVQQHLALQKANSQLEYLSRRDGLTGLINRRYFDEQFSAEYKRHVRTGGPLSVLMVDIDFFKSINDAYGHGEGDVYLQKIAAILKASMSRSSDLAARYGGEEFVCVLPDTGFSGALNIAEDIRAAVIALALKNPATEPNSLTVSIGVATLKETQSSVEQLLEQADVQLYRAKNSGRNRVCGILLSESGPDSYATNERELPLVELSLVELDN